MGKWGDAARVSGDGLQLMVGRSIAFQVGNRRLGSQNGSLGFSLGRSLANKSTAVAVQHA